MSEIRVGAQKSKIPLRGVRFETKSFLVGRMDHCLPLAVLLGLTQRTFIVHCMDVSAYRACFYFAEHLLPLPRACSYAQFINFCKLHA